MLLRRWNTVLVVCLILWSAGRLQAFEVETSYAPANNLSLTVKAIKSAKKNLMMNIYQMSAQGIGEALIESVNNGVKVKVLLEGQPTEGAPTPLAKKLQARIIKAMRDADNGSVFYMMYAEERSARRFRYNHAKYVVIDGESVLVGSENYNTTGTPEPGVRGNRGWVSLLHNAPLAKTFEKMFLADIDETHGDVINLVKSGKRDDVAAVEATTSSADLHENIPQVAPGKVPPPPTESHEAEQAKLISAPNTSLSGLVGMIEGATKSIKIQLMTFDSEWKGTQEGSPLYLALKKAAKRGITIQVLLNNEDVFNRGGSDSNKLTMQNLNNCDYESDMSCFSFGKRPKNSVTVDLLNTIGSNEKLDVSGRIANLKAMGVSYIHNKGAIIDDKRVLISSINWEPNSVLNNREAAVIIDSEEVAAYYLKLFNNDWKVSEELPSSLANF